MSKIRDERKNIAGPVMRKLRKRNGWTQKECSKLMRDAGWKKCTRSWLSRIESGEVTLRDLDLPYVYAVLGHEFDAEFESLMMRIVESQKSTGQEVGSLLQLVGLISASLLTFGEILPDLPAFDLSI